MKISAVVLREISPKLYGRIYVDSECLGTAFADIYDVAHHVTDSINNSCQFINQSNYSFLVGIAWADHNAKMIDVLGWKKPWENNVNIDKWSFKEGIYRPKDPSVTCENGLLIMSREIELRRICTDLNQFITSFPNIDDLNLGPTTFCC